LTTLAPMGHGRLWASPASPCGGIGIRGTAFGSLSQRDTKPWSSTMSTGQTLSRLVGSEPRANRLLGLLSQEDYERLHPHLQRLPLEYRQPLYSVNVPIKFVYFIETGVGSLVYTM